MNNPSLKHVCQFFIESVALEGQFLEVETEQMQNRGVPVLDADPVFDRGVSDFIGRTVDGTGLDSATGHPDGEPIGINECEARSKLLASRPQTFELTLQVRLIILLVGVNEHIRR